MRVCLVDQFAIYMLIPSTIQSTYYNVKVFLFMAYVTIVRVSECVEENQRERISSGPLVGCTCTAFSCQYAGFPSSQCLWDVFSIMNADENRYEDKCT